MHNAILIVACLACVGDGRRLSESHNLQSHGHVKNLKSSRSVQEEASNQSLATSSLPKPLKKLAMMSLLFSSSAGFNGLGLTPGSSPMHKDRTSVLPRYPTPLKSPLVEGRRAGPIQMAPIGAPYEADRRGYDPEKADKFYKERLPLVASRLAKVAQLTTSFNLKLLSDYLAWRRAGSVEGEPWPNEEDRAKESLTLATQLGPTFIKLGQLLSVRSDLITESYALELRKLQDAVPPFDSKEAKSIIKKELGVSDLSEVFQSLPDEPIASASIGQVYKGVLKDGREVAVKVQRPSILDEIALDLYVLRVLVPLQTRISNAINKQKTYPADLKAATDLVDEWGRGFVAETDYLYEATNMKEFSEAMKRRKLLAVISPACVDELSTSKVLVSEWIDGTRLDLDKSPDVPRLCSVAINAYLTMLLDTGVLHCDPHPGNLLRTKDGKLCILDWGMTLDVPKDLQYSLIEFIAHVTSEDYEAVPEDFVNLGFTPADQLERLRASNLADGLSFVMRNLGGGGGGKKVQARVREDLVQRYDPEGKLALTDEEIQAKTRQEFADQARAELAAEGEDVSVMDLQNVMDKMAERNRELFKVPPYVLYVARAFSTLEGIGLSADEDYGIITEAFPYISKRLLTDENPRAKAALRSLLYGSGDLDPSTGTPDFERLLSMGAGASNFSSVTSEVPGGGPMPKVGTATADSANELIDLLLSADGNYVQELILEESAKLVDASVRDAIGRASVAGPVNVLANALRTPKQINDATLGELRSTLRGPLRQALDLALRPAEVLDDISRVLPSIGRTSKRDEETLKAFGSVWDTLNEGTAEADNASAGDSAQTGRGPALSTAFETVRTNASPLLEQLAEPESQLRRRLPMLGVLSRRFAAILLRRVAERLEDVASQTDSSELARDVASRAAKRERDLANLIQPKSPVVEDN